RNLRGSGGEDRRVQRPSSTHPPLIRCVHVTAFGRCAVALMGGSPEPGFGCCALLSSAISLDCMRHDDKAGAKKSERDRYVKHGTHPYSRPPRCHIRLPRLQDDYVVS